MVVSSSNPEDGVGYYKIKLIFMVMFQQRKMLMSAYMVHCQILKL